MIDADTPPSIVPKPVEILLHRELHVLPLDGGLVHHHTIPVAPEPFHDVPYGGLPEVVGSGLHHQTEDSDGALWTYLPPDLVGDELLPVGIALDYGSDESVRYVAVVGEELLESLGRS